MKLSILAFVIVVWPAACWAFIPPTTIDPNRLSMPSIPGKKDIDPRPMQIDRLPQQSIDRGPLRPETVRRENIDPGKMSMEAVDRSYHDSGRGQLEPMRLDGFEPSRLYLDGQSRAIVDAGKMKLDGVNRPQFGFQSIDPGRIQTPRQQGRNYVDGGWSIMRNDYRPERLARERRSVEVGPRDEGRRSLSW